MSRSPRLALAGLVATALVAIAACGSSTSSGGVAGATGTPATSPSSAVSAPLSPPESGPAASPSSSGLNQKLITFQAVNNSNITGGGILTDLGNNQTAVTVGVVAAGVKDPMPAKLVPGDCASAMSAPAGSPAPSPAASAAASASAEASASPIPLNPGDTITLGDLSAGSSNTVINIGLAGLTSQPYALVIYKSAADMSVVACADVK